MLAQCPDGKCKVAEMDFESNGFFSSNEHWVASHGTPSVHKDDIAIWSYNGRGEGMNYRSYTFTKGRTYCVSFSAQTGVSDNKLANPNAYFRMYATQGVVSGPGGTTMPAIPALNQLIANQNWLATSPPNTQVYSYTFTATANFNNLWVYPFSPKLPQVNLIVRKLVICEIPPCKVDFQVALNDHPEDGITAISPSPQAVPAGAKARVDIRQNGSLVYRGLPKSYLAEPGNYTICMSYIFKDGRKCEKCTDICIGKWYTNKEKFAADDTVKASVKKAETAILFPEYLKEESSLQQDAEAIRLHPNPGNGLFELKSDSALDINRIEVYNMQGTLIEKQKPSLQTKTMNVDLSTHKDGPYFVKITLSDDRTITKKVMIGK